LCIDDTLGACSLFHPDDLEGATIQGLRDVLATRARWEGAQFTPPTEEEMDELRGYIEEWLDDIEGYQRVTYPVMGDD